MSTEGRSPSGLDEMAALVGRAWNRHYKERFEALAQGGSIVGWNTEAALTPLWGVRRRIPVLSGLSLSFPIVGFFLAALVSLTAGLLVPTVLFALAHGLLGDWIYYRHLESVRRRLATTTDERKRQRLTAQARVSGPLEFGLAAVLAVPMTLLVIVAGAPRVGPRPYYEGTMKADLRNLVTVQDSHFREHRIYASSVEQIASQYSASSGVTVRLLYGDTIAFAAEATYGGSPGRCVIFVGEARGLPPSASEGMPTCEGIPER